MQETPPASLATPASFGPGIRIAATQEKVFRLRTWRRFAAGAFAFSLLGFLPSVAWSFLAWGGWLLDRREVLTNGNAVPLPLVESTTFALLGWCVIAAGALHAWADGELKRARI